MTMRNYIQSTLLLFLFLAVSVAQIAPNGFTVKGTAFYASEEKLENAKAVLLDSTNRVVQQTWTSKKRFKRFGGGTFTFTNVPPGEYTLKISTGGPVDIQKKIQVKDRSLNLGWLRPIKEFPKYEIQEYPDSLVFRMRSIPTDFDVRDTTNIKHILIYLDGTSQVTRIDSVKADSLYYGASDSTADDTVFLRNLYLAYNDYGRLLYRSRSLEDRWRDLERRGGTIITVSGDTILYDRILFEKTMIDPQIAIFRGTDPVPEFFPFLKVHLIRTDEGYIENSIRKGFWTGVGVVSGYMAWRILREKSLKPVTSILPKPLVASTGNQFQTAIVTFPLLTIGWTVYDYVKDKRSNYFIPQYQGKHFPHSMFVFSVREWIGDKMAPVTRVIKKSGLLKRFKRKKT
jgi:hypothetical protein